MEVVIHSDQYSVLCATDMVTGCMTVDSKVVVIMNRV